MQPPADVHSIAGRQQVLLHEDGSHDTVWVRDLANALKTVSLLLMTQLSFLTVQVLHVPTAKMGDTVNSP
jgi:hypothetical protein